MRPYEDGESQRSARSKLGLFLEDMGFPAKNFKGSQLKNEELKQAKINDLRQRCNTFCNEFKEKFVSEGIEECQETLISYFEALKQRASKGKLVGGTIKNRKFTVKRLVEKVIKIRDSKGNGIDWEEVFNGLPEPSRFAQDRVYTMEEIRQICNYGDPRIKSIIYFFVSSGIRLGAWDYLKWGHITPQERNGKVVCALVEVYKDTPEQYPTLITVESYNALKEWMAFREKSGEKITPDSWVMRDYWDTEEGFTHGMAREPQQLKSSGIKSLIDSAVRRQGLRKNLTNGKKRHDVQLNHSFRKFRETALIKAVLNPVDVNILQGHANDGMVDHYYRPSADPNNRIDDYLVNEFLKAEKYLVVDKAYKSDEEFNEKLADIESKYEEQNREMMKKIKELEDKSIYFAFKSEMERFAKSTRDITMEEIAKHGGRYKIFEWSHKQQIDHFVEMMQKIGETVTDEQIELLKQYLKQSKQHTMIWQKMSKEEEEYDKYMEEEYAAEKERLSKMTEEEIEDEEKKSLELHAKIQREYNKMSPAEMENESRLYDRLAQKNARRK